MSTSISDEWRLNAVSITRCNKRSIVSKTAPTSPKQAQGTVGVAEGTSTSRTTPIDDKARAQVAMMVAPKLVRPLSCELKLNPESSNRPHPLGVRFSQQELLKVREKAKAAGCSTNEYIRASVFSSDYKPPRNPELIKALQKLNLELTKQGGNLNQIAKHLNNGKASIAEGEGMLVIIARSHLQTHKAVRAALSEGKEQPS